MPEGNINMKTSANYRSHGPTSTSHGWLPAQMATPRALDLSHWLSRAARGHSWNRHAIFKRRGLA
jgi:hypothetical protein